ncbi:MAG: hypothetical protein WC721_15165 [Victivallaceae bacterium]
MRRITVVFSEAPKYRSEEARECGCVPRLRVPRMRERKARKIVNAGNAEQGARMSGMIAKLKSIVLSDYPKYQNAEARECGSEKWKARKVVNAGNAEREARMSGMIAKLKNIVLNEAPKCRSRAREKSEDRRSQNENREIRRQKNKALCSTTIQSIGVGCPKWVWCSAVRVGRSCTGGVQYVQNV